MVIKQISEIVPSVAIMGGNRQSVRVSRTTKIVAKARLPKCSSSSSDKKSKLTLSFFWEIDSMDVKLDDRSRKSSRLYLSPGTLKGGNTYVLTLTVSIKEQPSLFATQSVVIQAIGTPLQARIRGGSKRVISSRDDLVLDGSVSRDPDREDSATPWYEWTCQELNGAPCFVRNGTNSDQFIRYQAPLSASQGILTVKNDTLEVNKTYKFIMDYYKGSRHASTQTLVTIKAGNPPTVRIFSSSKDSAKEDASKRIALKGYVRAHSRNTRIWLDCAVGDESYIDVTAPGVLLTDHEMVKRRAGFHRVGVVFARNALQEGLSYRFILHAENADGSGSSEVVITTNSPPSIGLLEAEYVNNTALESDFTLSASTGWEDSVEDTPLLYTFGFISPEEKGKKQYLGVPLAEKEIVTKLPAGPVDNGYNLTVFVEVSDIHGAKSFTSVEVTVLPPQTMDVAVINTAKGSIDEAFAANDLAGALSEISSTLSTFLSYGKLFNKKPLFLALILTYYNIYFCVSTKNLFLVQI